MVQLESCKDDNHASNAQCRDHQSSVEQGEFLLKIFHAEDEKDPAGHEAAFLRGNLAGWRSRLRTLYHDCAEEIVNGVLAKTCLAIPDNGIRSGVTHAF